MLGKDEKRFLELRSKLFDELEVLERNIADLEERRDELTAILDGSWGVSRFHEVQEEEFPPQLSDKQQLDDALVLFISDEGPIKRADINEYFPLEKFSSDDIRRALERCKRRGLIQVKGKAKAAVWTAAVERR